MNSTDRANRWLMTDSAPAVPFVTRLRVKNFRSIADVDVAFGPLNVLIGLNAAGKSNLLDSLLFLRQCLMERPTPGRPGTRRNRGRVPPALGRREHGLPLH